MLLGVGVDLIEIARMEEALARGDRLVNRLFTRDEIVYCRSHVHPARRFAARFAAKEAGMKAIGTGWSQGVAWKDFEVRHDPRGRPHLVITGRAGKIARSMGATHVLLSLAHERRFATAVVLLEGDEKNAEPGVLVGRAEIGLPSAEVVVTELLVKSDIPIAEPVVEPKPESTGPPGRPRSGGPGPREPADQDP